MFRKFLNDLEASETDVSNRRRNCVLRNSIRSEGYGTKYVDPFEYGAIGSAMHFPTWFSFLTSFKADEYKDDPRNQYRKPEAEH